MRKVTIAMVLGALAVNSPSPIDARDSATMQPTSQWAIEYADASCRLIRNFGDASQPLTLAFERFEPGPELRLGIAGDMLKLNSIPKNLTFRYGPEGPQRKSPLLATVLADGRMSFLAGAASLNEVKHESKSAASAKVQWPRYVAADELAVARKITSVTLVGGFKDEFTINLGSMEKPIQALQACVGELMHEWGVDPNKLANASPLAEPAGYPGSWMSSEDYPREMLVQHRQGIVGFHLVINDVGRVDRCSVDVEKSGPFEAAVCKALTKRAHFRPALDKDGKPISSLYSNTVRFQF